MDDDKFGNKRLLPNRGLIPDFFFAGVRKTTKNIRIVGIPADIRNEHLPNKSLDRHHSAVLFGMINRYESCNCYSFA
jgi:hypothetical protein